VLVQSVGKPLNSAKKQQRAGIDRRVAVSLGFGCSP
jgi:hypothetical protein